MKPAPFALTRPDCVDAALARLGGGGFVKPLGGTQSIGPMLNLRLVQLDELVDLSRIAALRAWHLDDDSLHIGAGVTHARIEDGELSDATHGLLPRIAAGIAYRAVRNRGTLGGSLAHADPRADWVAVMRLLGARLTLRGPGGARTLGIDEFLLGPFSTALGDDELLMSVAVPRLSPAARWAHRKTCRKPGEFAEARSALLFDPAQGLARAVLVALDTMPVAVDGHDAVLALQTPQGLTRTLAAAGIDDIDAVELLGVLLQRSFDDLDRFPAVDGGRP